MSPEARWNELVKVSGASFAVEASRTENSLARVGEDPTTLSAEAFDFLHEELRMFLGTRLLRAMRRGHTTRNVTVYITVNIDGEPAS
jgi:hypothetical protein